MSGHRNDEPPSGQMLIGRVSAQSDGTKVITPFQPMLDHQRRVAELVTAAQAFKDNPTPERQQALIKAALAL